MGSLRRSPRYPTAASPEGRAHAEASCDRHAAPRVQRPAAALRQAWRDGYLVKPPTLEPPADGAPRDRFLTKHEARKLLDACETAHVRVFIALAFTTGARKSSILSLTWDRVNFQTGMIDFQEPGRKLTNKRRSIVPIGAIAGPILELARIMAQSEYVVEYNGKPVPTGLRWSFHKACVRAGLNWMPTPHHIKRTRWPHGRHGQGAD